MTALPERGLKMRASRLFMPQSWAFDPLRKKLALSCGTLT